MKELEKRIKEQLKKLNTLIEAKVEKAIINQEKEVLDKLLEEYDKQI